MEITWPLNLTNVDTQLNSFEGFWVLSGILIQEVGHIKFIPVCRVVNV